jgi:anti-sigma regulatory factor (Ser/Thr protein kinase)
LRRWSGLNAQAPVSKFRHEALLYSGWAEFVAGTVPFIRGGLESDEPVLVVETAAKIEMLRVALGKDAEHVLFADMLDVGSNPARIIPAWHDFVSRHGAAGRPLRGIGEPIWMGRSADELAEAQRHESLLNTAFGHGQPWWLLCPYDLENLGPEVIEEAKRSHEFVTGQNTATRNELFRGIDASGVPFDQALPEPGTPVRGFDFGAADLGTLRNLVYRQTTAARLSGPRAAELVAAVHEVATNSILHGGGRGTMRIWLERSSVVCEIRDNGRFDNPLADRKRPLKDVGSPRGLWLANQLCDLVQIRTLPAGTVVRLHMNRNRGGHLSLVPEPESNPAVN